MKKYFIFSLITFLLLLTFSKQQELKAEPISISIASLSTLYYALGAAATIGLISVTQKDSFQRQLNVSMNNIRRAVGDSLETAWEEAQNLAQRIREWISAPEANPCESCTESLYMEQSSTTHSEQAQSLTQDRSLNCTTSPACCKGQNGEELFGDKFERQLGNQNRVSNSQSMAFRVFKDAKRRKIQCCLEWDTQHGRWEVFNRNGEHLGERSCYDLNNDPCATTSALPPGDQSGGHSSRFCNRR